MGNETSRAKIPQGSPPSEESFYHSFFKEDESEFANETQFSVTPRELMQILITNPDVLENKEAAFESLIEINNGEKNVSADLLKPFFHEYNVSRQLSKTRFLDKPISDPPLQIGKDSMIFDSMILLFQHFHGIENDEGMCQKVLASISQMTPGPNLIPPKKEFEYKDSSFTGLAPCQNIAVHGLSCSGRFLYVLDNGPTLHAFPVLENGALLAPITRNPEALLINPELTAFPRKLIVHCTNTADHATEGVSNSANDLIGNAKSVRRSENYFREDEFFMTDKPLKATSLSSRGGLLNVSDGVSLVSVYENFETWVFKCDSPDEPATNFCVLHAGSAEINPAKSELLTKDMLFSCPCETNGVYLSFFLKLDDRHYICRQFSLLTGEHVGDEVIETNGPILSICLDIIHNIHWVATGSADGIAIKAYQYTGVTDPFLYELNVPQQSDKKSPIDQILEALTFQLISSIGNQVPQKLLLNNETELVYLISDILNMVSCQQVPEEKYTFFIYILQLFVIVTAMNFKLFEKNEKIINQIRYLLMQLPKVFKNYESLKIVSLLLSFLFDSIMNADLIPLLTSVVKSVQNQLLEKLILEITKSKFLASVPTASKNALSSILLHKSSVKDIGENIFSLLLAQQKVLVREAARQVINDEFSSITIFMANIKPVTPLDYLSEYMQMLINQLTTEIREFKTISEVENSTIFRLYVNFLHLIWGVSDYHAISQMTLPLLSVLPSSIITASKNFADESANSVFTKLLLDTGFTFGVLTATLVKGGDVCDFENKNKWLIRPNMDLADNEDPLKIALNEDCLKSLKVSEEQITQLYKFWKTAINKKLKPEVVLVDRIVLSLIIKEEKLENEFNSSLTKKKVDAKLRQPLENMFKARTNFIALQREGKSKDIFMDKCKMLLNLKMEFTDEIDISKHICDFICSNGTAQSIIHFITNQKIRVKLTSIGFSLLQNLYTQKINNNDFYHIVAFALSLIENFDSLAAILKNEKRKHGFVVKFLSLVFEVDDPKLVLVVYKMLRSKVINEEEIGDFLKPMFDAVMKDTSNTKYFTLCSHFICYIPDAVKYLYSLIPNSTSLEPIHLYFIEKAITVSKECSVIEYMKLFSFVFTCHEKLLRNAFKALIVAMRYAPVKHDQMMRDILLLFTQLGKSLVGLNDFIKNCEFVTFFRQILLNSELPALCLLDIIQGLKPEKASDVEVAATFAILGGNIEVPKPYQTVSVESNLLSECKAITIGEGQETFFYELPFTKETQGTPLGERKVMPLATIPFNPYMFLDFDFVLSFFKRCCTSKGYDNLISVLYMTSLAQFVSLQEFAERLVYSDIFKDVLNICSFITNPFDTIQMTNKRIADMFSGPVLEECFGFGQMIVKQFEAPVLLSPPLNNKAKFMMNVTTDTDFVGSVAICEYSITNNIGYTLLDIPSCILYPSKQSFNDLVVTNCFRLEVKAGKLLINGRVLDFNPKTPFVRIVIAPRRNCRVVKIEYSRPLNEIFVVPYNTATVVGLNEMNQTSPNSELLQIPFYLKKESDSKLKQMLSNQSIIPRWKPVVPDNVNEGMRYPNPPYEIEMSPIHAVSMSQSLIDSLSSHLFAQLFSQWGTVLFTKLIASGLDEYLPEKCIPRIFSILLVMLEPFSEEKFVDQEFPFSPTTTVLKPHVPTNAINLNLTDVCKQALRSIAKKDKTLEMVERYITKLVNRKEVHVLGDPMTPVVFCPPKSSEDIVIIEGGNMDATSLMIGCPLFNKSINSITGHINQMSRSFPYCVSPAYAVLDFDDNKLRNIPISSLCVSKWYTSWAMSTPFEILLLLKALALLGYNEKRPFFVRSVLVELIISQSPYASQYAAKLLPVLAKEFIRPDAKNPSNYLKLLVLLGSFIKSNQESVGVNISSFFFQEHRCLSSPLPSLLCRAFPEFTSNEQLPKESRTKSVNIQIPKLDFTIDKDHALELFILYSSIVTSNESLSTFPFYEVFPFWYAIYSKDDQMGIRISPVKIEKKSSSLVVVSNPRSKQLEIKIEAASYIPPDAIITCSSQEDFEYCDVFTETNLPKIIKVDSLKFYVSITGDQEANIDMLSITEVDKDSSKKGSYEEKVDLEEIHDAFVDDMKSFVLQWKPENTAELVMNFPSNLYEQSDFGLLLQGCMQSPLSGQFPLRVVLLYALFIHRLNYISIKFKDVIPKIALNRVRVFLLCNSSMNDFINAIVKAPRSGPYLRINRREARRIILDGAGDVKKTIIGQFSKAVSRESVEHMQANDYPWFVEFEGESAIDAGGPRRELFYEIASSIFQPTSKLFALSPNGANHCGSFRDVYVPSQNHPTRDFLSYYRAIGTFLGVVMRHGFPQNLPFAPFIWKFLAGEVIVENDIVMLDARLGDLFKSIREVKDDPESVQRLNIQWSFVSWNGSVVTPHAFANRGLVQSSEVDQFIDATIQFRIDEVAEALTKIREGFYENIGFNNHELMSSSLLSLLAQGTNVITTAQLRSITIFSGFYSNPKPISNYWAAVERMTNEQRSKLLKFITTLTRLPNSQVNPSFNITISPMSDSNDSCLPGASTCFNKMYLPSYSTAEIAYQKIVYAIEVCDTMENC